MKFLFWLFVALFIAAVTKDVNCKKRRQHSHQISRRNYDGRHFGFRFKNIRVKIPKIPKIPKPKKQKEELVPIDSQPAKMNINSGIQKKNEYYIKPAKFDIMQKVHSLEDFIRLFKPVGYEIKREAVSPKASVSGGKPLGRRPDVEGVQEVVTGRKTVMKNVIYNGKTVVSDQSSDAVPIGCTLKNKNHRIPPTPGVMIYPYCVNLKKCGGCCPVSTECVAIETVNVTKTIYKLIGHMMEAKPMVFTEDAVCRCACVVKSTDCYPRQTYNKNRCQCECRLKPQTCPTGKHWSIGECGCICSNRRQCKSKLKKWDDTSCQCTCISDPCSKGKSRNSVSCRCETSASGDVVFRTKTISQSRLTNVKSKQPVTVPSIGDIFTDDDSDDEDDEFDDEDWY